MYLDWTRRGWRARETNDSPPVEHFPQDVITLPPGTQIMLEKRNSDIMHGWLYVPGTVAEFKEYIGETNGKELSANGRCPE